MRLKFTGIFAFITVFCALPACAWNDAGHRIVARIAWDKLTPEQRQKAIDILSKHPKYAEDLQAAVPEGADKATHDAVVFAKAATWPDMVKSRRDEQKDDHRVWHYIDYPVTFGPIDSQPPKISAAWDPAEDPDPKNIVHALHKNATDVKNTAGAVTAEDRAKALCWVLHLVGDIHQPLHDASLYSARYPNGDRGGNAIKVKGAASRELHGVWDSMLSRSTSAEFIAGFAKDLAEKYKPDPEELKVTDFEKWSLEGNRIAKEVAYDGGKLDNPPEDGVYPLDRNYLDRAKEVARKRAELAGERLAILLADLLK
jgi:hypothetical protein